MKWKKLKDIDGDFKLRKKLWSSWFILKYFSVARVNPFNRQIIQSEFFTHLKLCLADEIHNIKWVKIIQIWQNGGQLFSNIAGWCHILSLPCSKGGT